VLPVDRVIVQIASEWGPARVERTVAGDVVSTRRVRFSSQEDQIRFLRGLVEESRELAAIRARARDIVFRLYNCPPRQECEYALAIGDWVQRSITYVREMPEVFQTPTATIALAYGDCDDHTAVVCSLLEAIGIESELVGMAWNIDGETTFNHIFPRAVVSFGLERPLRIPLDTTLQRPVRSMTDPILLAHERRLRNLRVFVG